MSAFRFVGLDEHLAAKGSISGFEGATSADWLTIDIDCDDLETARRAACRLGLALVARYDIEPDRLLIAASGRRGFHVSLPVAWPVEPSTSFHRAARAFCLVRAAEAEVRIDEGVYDRPRLVRAHNTRHGSTGLFKVRFDLDELQHADADSIRDAARSPRPFEPPDPADVRINGQAQADWLEAVKAAEAETRSRTVERERRRDGPPRLQQATISFITAGAPVGERHLRLWRAAADLAEAGATVELAFALLDEAARRSGLAPKDIRRQIETGVAHGAQCRGCAPAERPPEPTIVEPDTDAERAKLLAELWGGPATPKVDPPEPTKVALPAAGESVELLKSGRSYVAFAGARAAGTTHWRRPGETVWQPLPGCEAEPHP